MIILLFSWLCAVVSPVIVQKEFSHSILQEELLLPDQPDSSNSEEEDEKNDDPDPADKECPVEEPDETGACPV